MLQSSKETVRTFEEWDRSREQYEAKIHPWMSAYRERKIRGQSHPVHDFLFEYYQFNRKQVINWHPKVGEILKGDEAQKFLSNAHFSKSNQGVFLNPGSFSETERKRMSWIYRLIETALKRPDRNTCYGLHEWAMVYKPNRIRHETTPLRLPESQIEKLIESSAICCTHYDAFRFFTDAARPLNSIQPTSDDRRINEQFGCVHFNMDLFKWCYKLYPWISSELTLDCFMLAKKARKLDMRASPYDLRELGYTPIRIESNEGKQEYQTQQKALATQGRILALRLLEECQKVLSVACDQEACV